MLVVISPRLPPAGGPRAPALPGRGGRAGLRALLRPAHRGHAALVHGSRRLPGPALRVRQAGGGAAAWPRSSRKSKKENLGLRTSWFPGPPSALMVLLIAAEPDLGTAFTLVPLFLTVAFLAGLRCEAILGVFLVMMVVGGLGWMFALKDYQKSRIYTFLDPNLDPRGAGLPEDPVRDRGGIGRPHGKGLQAGHARASSATCPRATPTSSSRCWPRRTGFVGVVVVLGLYLFVLWRAFETAQMARDRVGAFLVAGIAAILSFQVVYNVAMVAGLVPVKGLPAAPHELWRVLRALLPFRRRPHPQRPHAPLRQLIRRPLPDTGLLSQGGHSRVARWAFATPPETPLARRRAARAAELYVSPSSLSSTTPPAARPEGRPACPGPTRSAPGARASGRRAVDAQGTAHGRDLP